MKTQLSRRSFLAAGASWSLLFLGLGWAASARVHEERNADQRQLVESLRDLYARPSSALPLAKASRWNQEQALRIVSGDSAIVDTPAGLELRSFLDERIRADFVADRIQLLERRWLSDTEIAIAVLVAGPLV